MLDPGTTAPRTDDLTLAHESAQHIALGRKIRFCVVEALAIGEQQIVQFHLFGPPISRAMVRLSLRLTYIGQIGIAMGHTVQRFMAA